MEAMMKNFMKNMSKEDKQAMMKEFMASMSEEEKADRKKVLDKWLNNQKLQLQSIFQPAVETLAKRGIEAKQIETKSASETVKNTPECILTEAKTGGYLTLVMGRCGLHRTRHALLGSTVNKIVNVGAEIATCVVT